MPAAHAEDRRTRRAIAIRSLAATTWVERRSRCTPTSPPPHRRSRKSLHGRTRLGLVKCRSRANAPARPFFPGPSEAEVGERLVNPSRARNRSRSRHAYRHISSLRSASRWHMIAVRQAGSFHTGRGAQSPCRRKHHQSSDLGRRGPRAPDPRGLRSAKFTPQPPWPARPWIAACPRAPASFPLTFQHHAPRPPRATATHGHRLDRYPRDLRERIAHRVGCGGAFRSG